MGDYEHIVEFETYCDICKHKDTEENEEPCGECLDQPTNDGTHKPVKFEEKEQYDKRKGR